MSDRLKEYLICGIIAVITGVCAYLGILYSANQVIADRFYQSRSRGADSEIVVIGIDGRSLEELGAWGSWPRGVIADVINKLNNSPTGKPAVIGLDILFSGETQLEEDEKLVEAAQNASHLVVASSAKFGTPLDEDETSVNNMAIKGFEMPYEKLRKVTTQGHTNIILDEDGILRTSLHELGNNAMHQYSFAYEVYRNYADKMGLEQGKLPPLDAYGSWYIPYAGDIGEYSSGASFIQVLRGEKVPYVKDKIVLIGFDSPGMIDAYFTPINRGKKMMGVEINANIIQCFKDGMYKQNMPIGIDILIIIGGVFLITYWIRKSHLIKGLGIAIVGLIVYMGGAWVSYQMGYVMTIIYVPSAVVAVYLHKIFKSYIQEKVLRLAVSKKFENYVTESNIKYSKSIKDLLDSFIYTISEAVDERSPHTANHTKAIVALAQEFVDYLNMAYDKGQYEEIFDEQRKDQIVMSAALHDIGKLVIPLRVMEKATRLGSGLKEIEQRFESIYLYEKTRYLAGEYSKEVYEQHIEEIHQAKKCIYQCNTQGYLKDQDIIAISEISTRTYKNHRDEQQSWLSEEEKEMLSVRRGTLTGEERQIIEHHVSVTYKLLKGIKFSGHLVKVPEIAGNHHELLDGTGYPRGLKGDEIEVESRILTVLDIYEALTAKDRPYKKPLPQEKAFSILHEMADAGKLDKKLVTLFEQSRR